MHHRNGSSTTKVLSNAIWIFYEIFVLEYSIELVLNRICGFNQPQC